jgi:hypothetical protein
MFNLCKSTDICLVAAILSAPLEMVSGTNVKGHWRDTGDSLNIADAEESLS